jgi:hypothetical protein
MAAASLFDALVVAPAADLSDAVRFAKGGR